MRYTTAPHGGDLEDQVKGQVEDQRPVHAHTTSRHPNVPPPTFRLAFRPLCRPKTRRRLAVYLTRLAPGHSSLTRAPLGHALLHPLHCVDILSLHFSVHSRLLTHESLWKECSPIAGSTGAGLLTWGGMARALTLSNAAQWQCLRDGRNWTVDWCQGTGRGWLEARVC